MKKIIYFGLFIVCISISSNSYIHGSISENAEIILPSEETKTEIENMSNIATHENNRKDTRSGPPGSGTGGGGAVGTPLGEIPLLSLGVTTLIYLLIKKRKNLKQS